MRDNPIGRLYTLCYVAGYLIALIIGIACYIWHDELIYLLGFGFFGCFMAARVAMENILSSLTVSHAWLISFICTSLLNGIILTLTVLLFYLTKQTISKELTENVSVLLVGFQIFSTLFILAGLKSVSLSSQFC